MLYKRRAGAQRMSTDETFTRRVCAVLLTEVAGFGALKGEDEERVAMAAEQMRVLVRATVTRAGGSAEAGAGDSVRTVFDSVVVAVNTAMDLQREITAREFAGLRLQVRMGMHLGDVLSSGDAAFGDAINIAARLQGLARPGTICLSDGICRNVRGKVEGHFVDLGRQRLKNIADPVHAYLLVPVQAEPKKWRPPRVPAIAWVALAVVVLAVSGWLLASRILRSLPPEQQTAATPHPQVTLGVMLFKPRGEPGENAWMIEALRDGLNTQLSQLPTVKVYSKEFIDFLTTRKGLTDIEVANQLGITKMLSGSFLSVRNTVQVETHVVDVATGVLEASHTTSGRADNFLDVENEMVMGVIARLNLPLSAEERALLAARRSTDAEALSLLLAAEQGGPVDEPQPTPPPTGDKPRSALTRHQFFAALAPPVFADDRETDEQAIHALIERYRQATQAREIDSLADLYEDFTPEQHAAQERYFQNVRDLKVAIDNIEIAVVENEAVASYTRTDDFVDARTGRPIHVTVRLTKMLRRENRSWMLVGIK
jgi:class 3 adenylate cyclase/TolB-like protein